MSDRGCAGYSRTPTPDWDFNHLPKLGRAQNQYRVQRLPELHKRTRALSTRVANLWCRRADDNNYRVPSNGGMMTPSQHASSVRWMMIISACGSVRSSSPAMFGDG